jgi:hypothetical protein
MSIASGLPPNDADIIAPPNLTRSATGASGGPIVIALSVIDRTDQPHGASSPFRQATTSSLDRTAPVKAACRKASSAGS